MKMAYSDTTTSSLSFPTDDSSFHTTSSSSSLQHHPTEPHEMIPYFSPHHYHCITTLKTPNHHHHITCLAVHHNILYAASGPAITTFDLSTFSSITTPPFNGRDLSSGGFIKSIAFHDDKILTAHQDGKIRVWKHHHLITTLPKITDRVSRCLSPKNYVHVRRLKCRIWIDHNDAVSGLAVDKKFGFIYSVSWDKTLKIWRTSDLKCVDSVTAHDDAINAVTVSATGRVNTGSADGRIRIWERKKESDRVVRHSMAATVGKVGSTVNALALTKDGKVLLSGGCDGMIMAWESDDYDDDQMVMSGFVGEHGGAVLCLINLGVDGCDLLVSGSADRTVRIWGRGRNERLGLFRCLGVLEGHKKPVRSLAVGEMSRDKCNDVVFLCSGSLDGEIKIWELMVSKLINFISC